MMTNSCTELTASTLGVHSTPMSSDGSPLVDANDRIVGLYSFPRSGNTWLRTIIASAIGVPEGDEPLHTYVTDTQYDPVVQNPWTFGGRHWYFYKSHFKNIIESAHGQRFQTDKVVYIYRHPLDVFLSYVNFASRRVSGDAFQKEVGLDYESVDELTSETFDALFETFLEHGTMFPALTEFGSYFQNTMTFLDLANRSSAIHLVRYEDLLSDFAGVTSDMFAFLEFPVIDVAAVAAEADKRTRQDGLFFWRRTAGHYSTLLTPDQIGRFYNRYRRDLTTLGY